MQYHPELALEEIAVALRRQADEIVAAGLAATPDDVIARADQLTQLHRDPDRRSRRWMLGVDGEFASEDRRRTEIRNFLAKASLLRAQLSLSSVFAVCVETAAA